MSKPLKKHSANSKIGNESNYNTVIQNSSFENSTFIINSNDTILNSLKETHSYSTIQQLVSKQLDNIKTVHPLYPEYSATIEPKLNRLVSTPETDDALKKHPRKAKGAFSIDYHKYPYMNKDETPWNYAYRTQQKIELPTTAYQEYLGDIEDPFPIVEYHEGMITVIQPPEFPPAVEAVLKSGEASLSMKIRRVACMEYDKMRFESVLLPKDNPLRLSFEINRKTREIQFNFTRCLDCDFSKQLIREKILKNLYNNPIVLEIKEEKVFESTIKNNDLNQSFFKTTQQYIHTLECLLLIEQNLKCDFSADIQGLGIQELELIRVVASSIKNKWYLRKTNFDDTVRIDFDKLPDDIDKDNDENDELIVSNLANQFTLLDVGFEYENYQRVYKNARINNIKSVLKNKERKKERILLTFKPLQGKNEFEIYSKFNGLKVI